MHRKLVPLATALLALAALTGCGDDDGGNTNQGNQNNNNAAPVCGNGVLESGEVCDDGPDNSDTEPDACRTACRPAYCGDGVVDQGETCDDGNLEEGDGCLTTCVPNVCGDGFRNAEAGGEACDDGPDNSDERSHACRTDCRLPWCGDGVFDPDLGEACDDATQSEAGGCLNTCTRHDGFVLSASDRIGYVSDAAYYQAAAVANGTHLVMIQDYAGVGSGSPFVTERLDPSGDLAEIANAQPGWGKGWALVGNATTGFSLVVRSDAGAILQWPFGLDGGASGDATLIRTADPCVFMMDAATHPDHGLLVAYEYRDTAGCLTAGGDIWVTNGQSTPVSAIATAPDLAPLSTQVSLAPAGAGFVLLVPESQTLTAYRLDGQGAPIGTQPLEVNEGFPLTTAFPQRARAARLGDGKTLIVFTAGDPAQVYGRVLLNDGTFAAAPFALATTQSGDLSTPDVVATADETFLVSWARANLTDLEIRGRGFLGDGSSGEPDVLLGTFEPLGLRDSTCPRLSASERGVLVVWASKHPDGNTRDVLVGTFLPRVVD